MPARARIANPAVFVVVGPPTRQVQAPLPSPPSVDPLPPAPLPLVPLPSAVLDTEAPPAATEEDAPEPEEADELPDTEEEPAVPVLDDALEDDDETHCPPMHCPAEHGAPSGTLENSHCPVPIEHCPDWHSADGVQSIGAPGEHVPDWHASATVQGFPSSHGSAFGNAASAGQLVEAPSQLSTASHIPTAARHTYVLGSAAH